MPWPPWKTARTDPLAPVRIPSQPLFPVPSAIPQTRLNIPPSPSPQQKASPVSDQPDADQPLNLGPYIVNDQAPRAAPMPPPQVLAAEAPSVASELRMALMHIGGDVTKLLACKGTVPEDMAKALGLDPEQLYLVMTGREADVSVRVLDAICSYLGATLVVHLALPDSPPAAA